MPGGAAAHVGLLHRSGQATRGPVAAQRRAEPWPGARHDGRGVYARLPASDRGTAVRDPLSSGIAGTPQAPGRTPYSAGWRASGTTQPQAPLRCPGAEDQCSPGDILVVTTTSPGTDGAFGELLATVLRYRGSVAWSPPAGCGTWPNCTR